MRDQYVGSLRHPLRQRDHVYIWQWDFHSTHFHRDIYQLDGCCLYIIFDNTYNQIILFYHSRSSSSCIFVKVNNTKPLFLTLSHYEFNLQNSIIVWGSSDFQNLFFVVPISADCKIRTLIILLTQCKKNVCFQKIKN